MTPTTASGVLPNSKPKRVRKKKTNTPVVAPASASGTEATVDEEASVGGRWSDEAISNILDLYEEEWLRIDKGNLKLKHWTYIRTEHHRQMPLAVRRSEDSIKSKVEKFKAEWRLQKASAAEQTGGEGSNWPWFERMTQIMTGSAKGEGIPGGVDMGCGGAEELEEDDDDTIIMETQPTPNSAQNDVVRDQSQSTPAAKGVGETVVSPKTASCQKPGVDGKPNARKRALTGNAAYMAEAISNFAEGSFKVEQHKLEAQERMHQIQMETNKDIALKQMDMEMETRRMDMEARREAAQMQLRIAEMFSQSMRGGHHPA